MGYREFRTQYSGESMQSSGNFWQTNHMAFQIKGKCFMEQGRMIQPWYTTLGLGSTLDFVILGPGGLAHILLEMHLTQTDMLTVMVMEHLQCFLHWFSRAKLINAAGIAH